jgi:hypothetical protein
METNSIWEKIRFTLKPELQIPVEYIYNDTRSFTNFRYPYKQPTDEQNTYHEEVNYENFQGAVHGIFKKECLIYNSTVTIDDSYTEFTGLLIEDSTVNSPINNKMGKLTINNSKIPGFENSHKSEQIELYNVDIPTFNHTATTVIIKNCESLTSLGPDTQIENLWLKSTPITRLDLPIKSLTVSDIPLKELGGKFTCDKLRFEESNETAPEHLQKLFLFNLDKFGPLAKLQIIKYSSHENIVKMLDLKTLEALHERFNLLILKPAIRLKKSIEAQQSTITAALKELPLKNTPPKHS